MKQHFKAVMTDKKYRQRKFLLACFAMWVITIGLLGGYMTGAEFNMALMVILGMYGAQSYFGSMDDREEGPQE